MTGNKKYEHFDEPQENCEPVISGAGMEGQKYLCATVNKWVRLARNESESDVEYMTRLREDRDKMKSFRSHLLVSKGFDTSTSRVTAVVAQPARIGYSWMPVTGELILPVEKAKALCIWYNSTIGRCLLRTVGGRKLAYPMFNPASWHDLPIPQMDNENIVNLLGKCYDETFNTEVSSFRDGQIPLRDQWDDAVAEALEIDRVVMREMAERLNVDPYVSQSAYYETK